MGVRQNIGGGWGFSRPSLCACHRARESPVVVNGGGFAVAFSDDLA